MRCTGGLGRRDKRRKKMRRSRRRKNVPGSASQAEQEKTSILVQENHIRYNFDTKSVV